MICFRGLWEDEMFARQLLYALDSYIVLTKQTIHVDNLIGSTFGQCARGGVEQ